MNYKPLLLVFLVTICQSVYCVDGVPADGDIDENDMPPNVDQASKISFESPKMSDEEQFSAHLPTGFKCDACTAIAYQVYFKVFTPLFSLKLNLQKMVYLRIREINTCLIIIIHNTRIKAELTAKLKCHKIKKLS